MRPTIYEAAGGAPAFLALARAHHARCLADPELNHPFSHGGLHPFHVERLAAYWGEALGGPPTYTTEYTDHYHVLYLHSGTGKLGDLPDRFVACFVAAMDDAGLPPDQELRSALRGYMEWAVNDVLAYRDEDAVVPALPAMPHFSWDGPVTV